MPLLRQRDMLACPYVIMMPEHYNADCTCRCNDPNHKVMESWGYTWNADDLRWDANEEGEE